MTSDPQRPAQFTRESAERVAHVVRRAELAPVPTNPLAFDPYLQPKQRPSLVIGKAAASWPKGTNATVDVWDGESVLFFPAPAISDPPAQIENVRNLFGNIDQGKWVAVMLATDRRYYVISAEC